MKISLTRLKKLALENGISLKHLNGKMLKKSELAEKLMEKGALIKSPKKSRKASKKKSRKKKSRKASKKKSRKKKSKKKKSRKKKSKKKKSGKKRPLNEYMKFAGKHRKSVMNKFQEQGKKGRDLISATGKELGKMYRAQKSGKSLKKSRKKKSRKASKKKSRKKKSRKKKSRKKKSRKASKKKSRKKKSKKKKSKKKKSRKYKMHGKHGMHGMHGMHRM